MIKNVVAISGKQYSGKDTCADIIVPELRKMYGECIKFPFARTLKQEFIKEFLPDWTLEELELNKGELRKDLIAYGSTKRAENIDYFCERLLDAEADTLVVSDLRFASEYDFLTRNTNVFFLRVNSPLDIRRTRGVVSCVDDPSETELDTFMFDYFINNKTTKHILKTEVLKAVIPEIKELFDTGAKQLKLDLHNTDLLEG